MGAIFQSSSRPITPARNSWPPELTEELPKICIRFRKIAVYWADKRAKPRLQRLAAEKNNNFSQRAFPYSSRINWAAPERIIYHGVGASKMVGEGNKLPARRPDEVSG